MPDLWNKKYYSNWQQWQRMFMREIERRCEVAELERRQVVGLVESLVEETRHWRSEEGL